MLGGCSAPGQREAPGVASCSLAEAADLNFLENDQSVPAIIYDTDYAGDVDDVGALAILHTMADSGEAEILSVMISSGDHYAFRAVDTINTYYGRRIFPSASPGRPRSA